MRSGDVTSGTPSLERKPKTFKLKHAEPGDFRLDYILLPVGYGYNSEFKNAKRGDMIRFFGGGVYPIVSVKKIKLGRGGAELLCQMRYGVSLRAAKERWKMNARLEGHGAKALSEDECLWIVYDKEGKDPSEQDS